MKTSELESKDLMIGDIVYACIEEEIVGEAKYKIISKIRDLEANGDFTIEFVGRFPDELDWQDGDDVSWIEPIPLTAEILEKNGFACLSGHTWWYNDFHISLSNTQVLTLVCGRAIQFSFVHELQHALRLCGIDKEIVL